MDRNVEDATSRLFRLLGRVRRARAFHPVGAAFRASIEVHGDEAEPALRPGTHPAVVRFSRGIGWRALPDIHGVAIRLPDAHGPGRHQDLLLSTVLSPGVGRFVPGLATTLTGPAYSSIAPYDTPRGRLRLGGRVVAPGRFGLGMAEDMVWTGQCRVELSVARGLGRWQDVATVVVHADRLTDDEERDLGFDPWHTADGFEPAGWVNRLRRPAYPASRAGRPGGANGSEGPTNR